MRFKSLSAESPVTRWLSLGASVVVVVGSLWSARSLNIAMSDLRFTPLLISAVLGIAILPLNATEYRLSSQLAGSDVSLLSALHITVLASALNVLPVPLGAAVRVQGLREAGVQTGRAAMATASLAVLWLAISTLASFFALLVLGQKQAAILFGGAATALICATIILLGRRGAIGSILPQAVLIECLFVVLAVARLNLVLLGLDVDLEVSQAVVVASSSALASAIGVLPGAFGIFEGLAAALAAVVGLAASAGFLATAILRLMAGVTVGLAAMLMSATHNLRH